MRSRSRALLFALAAAVLRSSLAASQYAPRWHVGDWWVVKTWHRSVSGEWAWDYTRYDIVGAEKVGKRNCFVVEARFQEPGGQLSEAKNVYYVRTGDWLVIRQVIFHTYRGVLRADTLERPLGIFGPFLAGEPRLPRFPLQLASQDTAFRLQTRDDYAAHLREISQIAESTTVRRLLREGDAEGGRVLRPTGVVYQVRSEVGGVTEPGSLPGEKSIGQSLQLWCEGQPWRVFEELVNYNGPDLVRDVLERSWLIASGHKKR